MNGVPLRLLARGQPGGLGEVQVALDETGGRVMLWRGPAPFVVPDHPALAPVVLDGEIDGLRSYAERIPEGLRMSEARPPEDLMPYIVSRVLEGLQVLHHAGQVHGAVGPDRIALGTRGEVVLVGRGRQGGHVGADMITAISLLPTKDDATLLDANAGSLAADVGEHASAEDPERLAAWVRERLPRPAVVAEVLLLPSAGDAVDEVVPDLGPDRGRGILDRWMTTTTPGVRSGGDETTDEVSSTHNEIAVTLWGRLSAPEPPAPSDRFALASGPSPSVRALLAAEPPEVVGLPFGGDVGLFVLHEPTFDDQPTIVRHVGATGEHLERTVGPGRGGVPLWVQWLLAAALGALLAWAATALL